MDISLTIWITVLVSVQLLINSVLGEVYCFKKIRSSNNRRQAICKKPIKRSGDRLYRSAGGCCRNGGAGYATTLEPLGSRGRKYKCNLCSERRSTKSTETLISTTAPTSTPVMLALTTTTTRAPTIPDLFVSNRTGWSDWGPWSDCSKTCEVGVQTRRRICYKECEGVDIERQPCSLTTYCPVDGNWGPWSGWTDCSTTCGGGMRRRERRCNDPVPTYGGKNCSGLPYDELHCNIDNCPIDGNWSEWQVAEPCTVTCGKGVERRVRQCNNPPPQNGGKSCEGRAQENVRCNLTRCPIDGDWSLWSDWSTCAVTCGEGTHSRSRACISPRPKFGGRDCVGPSQEMQTCYSREPCPVDGNWSDWAAWGPCLATPCKGEKGNQTRSRTCTNPQPRYRGSMCSGSSLQIQECFNNFGCPVDGQWCPWTEYTECLISDKGMFRRRTRMCSCPLPESGGRLCAGDDFEIQQCDFNGDPIICNREQLADGSGYVDDEDC